MANNYTNYKVNLSTTALTSVYTVPTATSAIIKSIRVSNKDVNNNCTVSISIVDVNGVSYTLETERTIEAKRSQELLATGNMAQDTSDSAVAAPTPLILKESEILKAQAQNGGDLSIIISVLQITNA